MRRSPRSIAALFSGEPLLAHWTQTFMGSAARLSGAVLSAVSAWRVVRQADGGQRLGRRDRELHDHSGSAAARAMLAVVLAGALVTYGGVSLFVAFFVLAPMAQELFRAAGDSAASDAGGDRARHLDLHHVGAAGHAVDPERDPDAVLRHDALRRARARHYGIADHAWLRPVVARIAPRSDRAAERRRLWRRRTDARPSGSPPTKRCASAPPLRASSIRPRSSHGAASDVPPPVLLAALPLVVVLSSISLMSFFILPRLDYSFLAEAVGERRRFRGRRRVGGGHGARRAIVTVIRCQPQRLPALRAEHGRRRQCLGAAGD